MNIIFQFTGKLCFATEIDAILHFSCTAHVKVTVLLEEKSWSWILWNIIESGVSSNLHVLIHTNANRQLSRRHILKIETIHNHILSMFYILCYWSLQSWVYNNDICLQKEHWVQTLEFRSRRQSDENMVSNLILRFNLI